MTIYQWIENYVPGGHRSQLGAMLDVAYNIEYGAETTVQSSLNMIYLLGYTGPGQFRDVRQVGREVPHPRRQRPDPDDPRGEARVADHDQHAADGDQEEQRRHVQADVPNGSARSTVVADHVVLALPFTMLRSTSTSRRPASTPSRRRRSRSSGWARTQRSTVQFKSRFWRDQGCTGETYSDRGYQNTWEVSRAQSGKSGLLVWYTGGDAGVAVGSGTPAVAGRTTFLKQIEPVLPGATAQWNGKVTRDYWTGNPWTKGSYSYWKAGQYTRFVGAESERSAATATSAGEHTSQRLPGLPAGRASRPARRAAKQRSSAALQVALARRSRP